MSFDIKTEKPFCGEGAASCCTAGDIRTQHVQVYAQKMRRTGYFGMTQRPVQLTFGERVPASVWLPLR